MPYKANEPRRHKIPKARYKIENEYDAALRRRGSLTVWVTPEVPSDLAPKSVRTTMAGVAWMSRSHHIWWAGAKPDGTPLTVPVSPGRQQPQADPDDYHGRTHPKQHPCLSELHLGIGR
jgi:hypothetical protein